jgi:hypothetical protein
MNKRMFILILLGLVGCSSNQGTETGNPSMQIQFSSYAQQSVSRVELCIHQIRFKAENSSSEAGENVNVAAGLVVFSPAGTSIAPVTSIKFGTYRRVDVLVKNECGTGNSIVIQNGNGTFSSNNPLTLRFIGELQISMLSRAVLLGVEPFVGFFDTVTSDAQLENGVETIDGEM